MTAPAQKDWVRKVMNTSFSTFPPAGAFTRTAREIADAGDEPGVAPGGLTSWQRMVLFHHNRGGRGLSDERKQALREAVRLLAERRAERRARPEDYDPGTLLPRDVYHGSPTPGIEELQPRPSRVLRGESAVFATPDRDLALSFLAPWRDDDFQQGYVNGQPYMREQYPGAFDKIYKGKTSIPY